MAVKDSEDKIKNRDEQIVKLNELIRNVEKGQQSQTVINSF